MAPQPIIIAVMGPMGSGKTNFINKLTGTKEEQEAHQFKSYTHSIKEFTVNLSRDRQYVFADIPAFDDPSRSDQDTLRTIAEWLGKNRYRANVKLKGIIYTHRITDERMSRSVCKNLEIFSRLCGDKAAGGVRLVTTMWDQVENKEFAENRVSQLETNVWKPLIDAGARHKRFEENSSGCAWGIVEDLTGKGEALLLQEELVDMKRKLNETTAGKFLYTQIHNLWQEQKETVKQLQEEAKAEKDPELVEALEAEQQRLVAELRKTSDEMDKLKIPLFRRIALRFSSNTQPNQTTILQFRYEAHENSVAKSDYVIFVVSPTEAEKTSVISPLLC
ncbi:hypothetical protein EDD15DRAFT_2240274 [Pisolithus albus]|nr:hypothetical protein EDD15DRAFT_2240274 [Pisolithus albus]